MTCTFETVSTGTVLGPAESGAPALSIKEELLIYIMHVPARYSRESCLRYPVDTSITERIPALAFVHLSKVTLDLSVSPFISVLSQVCHV
jgi:hypothetical protein